MKLARFSIDGRTVIGAIKADKVYEMNMLLGDDAPTSIREILAAGSSMRSKIEKSLAVATEGYSIDRIQFDAPIPDPQKYLAIGMNYQDHAEEARAAGIPIPKTQLWFNKQVTCITGPYADVQRPRVSDKLDYEAELGVVIGRRCRYVSEADARSVVGGYFVANDVTARDWQAASPTFTLGKSFDTHGPIGPWITTDDEVGDPHALEMRLFVNGELRQRQVTGNMIYNIWQQIHHLSQVMTLEPGDLIATGTCAGVGIALNRFLQPGDVVRVEIDGLGHIENRVVEESAV
ncbi:MULTISPECIES: fumarylacetoacetate hydrolase family protein [Burkholderia]|uniref:fumarylacetoacetate hydrolase family protein n=1 Tax=Burkholderia TaxID=32008 RepID=UPI00078E2D64|nr:MULTISPECIES: fumarylacetoacetate hydrolase family protein [Burkholderia]AMU04675.1 5-carboxymethyl-2-hydroxymuconate isomerase [Burkholderia cenocepacia]RQS24176.1 fumarylacetoacetate hydrolase family protein [Burkholderia sp. Bp8995]RQS38905.1 fumarylacetoacetate hydrolase family protein [Burkholderia sp. Bp8989]